MTRAELRRQWSAQTSQAAVNATSAAPDHGQRDESVTPSSRAGSGRRRRSQTAPSTADVRNARRICSANRGQRDESVSPSNRTAAVAADRRKPQSMQQAPRQITDSVSRACPHQPHSSGRRRQTQAAVNATSAAPDRDQRSDNVPPSSRTTAVGTGIRKPQSMQQAPRQITDSVTKARPHRAAQAFVFSPLPSPAKSSH